MTYGVRPDEILRLSASGVRLFLRNTAAWGLDDAQRLLLLGDAVTQSMLNDWRTAAP